MIIFQYQNNINSNMPPKKSVKKTTAASAESKAKAPAVKKAAAKPAPKKPVPAPATTQEAPKVQKESDVIAHQQDTQVVQMPSKEEQASSQKPTIVPVVQAPVPSEVQVTQELPASPNMPKEELKNDAAAVAGSSSKKLEDMTDAERKKLRQMRFKSTDLAETNTIEMQEKLREHKERLKARAERFGTFTKEMNEERIKERQKRFGIETKESLKEKIEQRKRRFAVGPEPTVADDPEMAQKIQDRIARFGKIEEEEDKSAFKRGNRKFKKFHKQRGEDSKEGGNPPKFLGKRKRSNSKKGPFKRFKGNKQQ